MPPLTTNPTVEPVVGFLADHPSVLPVVAVVLVAAWLLSGPLSRRLRYGRVAAAALVVAAAVPFAMTLSPAPDPGYPLRWCVTALRPVQDWGRGGEELANLVLLAPFALLAVALLGRPAAVLAVLLGAVFPVGVELVQYAVPTLGRTCETTDVLLNLSGLALGVAVGLPVRLLLRRARRGRGPRRSASPGT